MQLLKQLSFLNYDATECRQIHALNADLHERRFLPSFQALTFFYSLLPFFLDNEGWKEEDKKKKQEAMTPKERKEEIRVS